MKKKRGRKEQEIHNRNVNMIQYISLRKGTSPVSWLFYRKHTLFFPYLHMSMMADKNFTTATLTPTILSNTGAGEVKCRQFDSLYKEYLNKSIQGEPEAERVLFELGFLNVAQTDLEDIVKRNKLVWLVQRNITGRTLVQLYEQHNRNAVATLEAIGAARARCSREYSTQQLTTEIIRISNGNTRVEYALKAVWQNLGDHELGKVVDKLRRVELTPTLKESLITNRVGPFLDQLNVLVAERTQFLLRMEKAQELARDIVSIQKMCPSTLSKIGQSIEQELQASYPEARSFILFNLLRMDWGRQYPQLITLLQQLLSAEEDTAAVREFASKADTSPFHLCLSVLLCSHSILQSIQNTFRALNNHVH